MKLEFDFGTTFELNRVNYTLSKLKWYILQKYKPRLPKNITIKSTKEKIESQILKEFKKEKYEKIAKELEFEFIKMEDEFSKKLVKIFGKNISKTFIIHLTTYGVDGSFKLPNEIVFNINSKKDLDVIPHEIIHLLIENLSQRYKISHLERERIVDLILHSEKFSFLKYNHWHKNYQNVEKYIDNLFNKHFFKNPEDFFSKIKSIRN